MSVYVPYSRDISECDVQVAYAMYSRKDEYNASFHGKQFDCNVFLNALKGEDYNLTAVEDSIIDYIFINGVDFEKNVDSVCEENYTLTQCISEYPTQIEEVKDCVESE